MCGLAGCWQRADLSSEDLEARVRRMTDTIVLRGPDDDGAWVDPRAGIALGFRRLSILDLSAEGHQPKASASGRFVLTFNGEIYNFQEIRRTLEGLGATFRGHSDTEVILAAFEQWGVEATLVRLNGMFAIACWDKETGQLHLARDPMGIKPMYVGRHGTTWFWGSELKVMAAHPDFAPAIDPDAVALYFRHGFVPGPYSIYQGIRKLQPGHLLTLDSLDSQAQPRPFWTLGEAAARAKADPFTGTDQEAIDTVEAALHKSIGLQMVSDVPLGAFLSGGIDSSLIATFMQLQSPRPVQTFSIGFQEDAFNEAHHARLVAHHLGTDHAEWMVTGQDALDLIPRLPDIYDEPFADPAAIPTCLVSRLARKSVTVSLSGDGGDEIFGGYEYHISAQTGRLARALALPRPARRALGSGLSALGRMVQLFPGRTAGYASEAFKHRAMPYRFTHPVAHYRDHIADQLGRGNTLLASPRHPDYLLNHPGATDGMPTLAESFMYLDSLMMLPDEYLTKVDRATMSVSLEGRVPFLDTDIVSLAWRLPMALKVRGPMGKWVLRRVLERHVPREIINRPKHGFSVPIGGWLRGPLLEWASDLLDPGGIREGGLLDEATVTGLWQDHQTGRRDNSVLLWRLLMFQAWQRNAGLGPRGGRP